MAAVVRARALQGLPGVLTGLGADPAEYFGRFGLPLAGVSDETYVPIVAVNALMDAAASEQGCPWLALKLAGEEDPSILGPLAVAMEASLTAAQALECAVDYLFVHSPAMRVAREPDHKHRPDVIAVTYDIVVPGAPYPVQGMELGLATAYRILQLLAGRRDLLLGVQMRHDAPKARQAHLDFFGVLPEYNQSRCALLLHEQVLGLRLTSGNDTVRRIAIDYLARNFQDADPSTASQVRAAVVGTLGATPMTIDQAARLMNVHARTLQRRLNAEGTSFDRIVDEVRRDTAHRSLTTTQMSMSQVARSLGLAEQATLTRACRRWFGRTPTEIRRTALLR
jgi:AraC-like DNA-binding protein